MSRKVYIVGVGMTKFMRPSNDNPDYPQLGKTAINRALIDAQCHYNNVQAVIAGYVYGDSTCGQKVVYEVGMTGVPVHNVNNNCATSSSALHLGKNLVAGGVYDCVLCFGFEKMQVGSIGNKFSDRTDPLQKFIKRTLEIGGKTTRPKAYIPYFFQNAGEEHMRLYGSKPEHFAMVSAKNHQHSVNNPYSQHRKNRTTEQVLKSPKVNDLLTVLQCCPTSDGASAVVICDEATMKKLKRENEAVEILAVELTTDTAKMYQNAREVVGFSMAKRCAQQAYQKAGIKPSDINCVELHDCFSVNELLTYQALGLCEQGKGHQFALKGDNTYGGKCVVNPSGGLHAKGHPLGATGIAQLAELVWQLRGIAGKRQVPNCKYALQHNLGLGGACVVGIYKKYNDAKSGGTQDLKELEALEASLTDHPLPKL